MVDGPSRPLGSETAAEAVAGGDGEERFATATGQRQALVFRLLDEGLDLVDVVERTGIEAAVVRAIFGWLGAARFRSIRDLDGILVQGNAI